MTKVLVTGAGGFVGSHVVEALLARTPHDVVCVESFRHNGAVDRLLDAIGRTSRVTVLVHDLTAPLSRSQVRYVGDVDHIVNVASRCHVGQSIEQPVEFVRNNVDLILNVLELARELRPRRFVQVSTDEVYGPHEVESAWEHVPSSPYAASKAAQEDVCHAYRRTYDVPVTIFNSANMFGERQSQLAFIPRVIRAVTRDEVVPIHYYRGEPGSRNYTYVRNVAERIIDDLDDGRSRHVVRVVLGGQRRVDNLELATRVAELLGRELRHVPVNAEMVRPGYDPSYASLTSSAWSPSVSFDEGLKRTVEWAQRDPHALEA